MTKTQHYHHHRQCLAWIPSACQCPPNPTTTVFALDIGNPKYPKYNIIFRYMSNLSLVLHVLLDVLFHFVMYGRPSS